MNSRYSPITLPSVAANEMSVGNPDKSIVNWVRSAAIPLATVEPRQGYKDLEALRAVIGNARIVSFGEATHGTREIRKLKHRMLEFCIAEFGFTMLGIEAPFPESLAVDSFVLDGNGDAADALLSDHRSLYKDNCTSFQCFIPSIVLSMYGSSGAPPKIRRLAAGQ